MAAIRLLLDTHVLLWWLFDDPKLSAVARSAIVSPANEIVVSAASAWEIATKHRLGRLPEAGAGATASLSASRALPGPHKDPFDRMLVARARIENLVSQQSIGCFATTASR